MNCLDIGILVIIALSAFNGLKQGLIKAILSFVGLIVGVTLASRFYGALAALLTFIPQQFANIAAFVIILVAILIIASIISAVLTKVASAILLGWLNRLGGAVFGFLMGAIFVGAALAIWLKFLGQNDIIRASTLAAILLDKLPLVLNLLPPEFDSIRQLFK